jgi:hypothetical protein
MWWKQLAAGFGLVLLLGVGMRLRYFVITRAA